MKELRERFEIDEGEGGPVEYLIGIAVDQNKEKGTIHLSMDAAITKLCHGSLTPEELAKAATIDTPMLVAPLKKQSERTGPDFLRRVCTTKFSSEKITYLRTPRFKAPSSPKRAPVPQFY